MACQTYLVMIVPIASPSFCTHGNAFPSPDYSQPSFGYDLLLSLKLIALLELCPLVNFGY